jgi:hypothetical protein
MENEFMKSEEALKQIAYLKELAEKTVLNIAFGYQYFILWGILCVLGYISNIIFPMNLHNYLWSIISIIGVITTIVILIINRKKYGLSPLFKRIGMQCLILFALDYLFFGFLIYYKIYELLHSYWPFQIGIIYIIASIHLSRSLTFIGLWLILTSILSFFIPIQIQNIFMAITFGGGLLFTGILFRHQIMKAEDKIVE